MPSEKLSKLLKKYAAIAADPNKDPELTAVCTAVETALREVAEELKTVNARPVITRPSPEPASRDEALVGLAFDLIALGMGVSRKKTHPIAALEFRHPSAQNRFGQRMAIKFDWAEGRPRTLVISRGLRSIVAEEHAILPFEDVSPNAVGDAVSDAIAALERAI